MLADKESWKLLEEVPHVQYDRERRSLRLVSERDLEVAGDPAQPLDPAIESDMRVRAQLRLASVPATRDEFGTFAFWDAPTRTVMAAGAVPGAVPIFVPSGPAIATDLAIGYDGVLYMAIDGRVVMQDRRDRWDPLTLSAPDEAAPFQAWRLAAAPDGGAWVLDRENRKLARVRGLPFPTRPFGGYSPETFRPCEENPDPPNLTVLAVALPGNEEAVAITCSPEGRVAVLTWRDLVSDARVRCLTASGEFQEPIELMGARHPYGMTWVDSDRVAVLLPDFNTEAPVFVIPDAPRRTRPVGDLYPLRDYDNGLFVNGVTLPPHYGTRSETVTTGDPSATNVVIGSSPLHHLSLPSFAREGKASNEPLLDSGSGQTAWHRLYVEADIPEGCGIKVLLAATDDEAPPVEDDLDEWYEHQFGEIFAYGNSSDVPRAAWVPSPSEIPHHPGLLGCKRRKNRTGLFTVLIQRTNRRVRTLRGRYLHVLVKLMGDQRATPEIAALRAYGSRFSYLNRYLPELYRETLFGKDADEEVATSTPADFLERFLDNFEGILTPLEDRIASAYLLTDPRTTTDETIEWLGSWIGVAFDPAYPQKRRRRLLENAPELFRKRGTLDGLKMALDLATESALSGGEVLVLEDYRLRRTFATILGADLADESDPLLGGLAVSGNSFVGDTLFLGDENRKEFLALFSADLPVTQSEEDAIKFLFDSLSHRVTVLVHQEVQPQDLGLIRRVVDMETPAHVMARVITATESFMVGIASLVGVDTYLSPKPKPQPVRVEASHIGIRDLIQRPPSLDPRLEGGRSNVRPRLAPRPVAEAGDDMTVDFGESFTLDASGSRAAEGQRIVRYIWTLRG
jgi:phage tail-like protein